MEIILRGLAILLIVGRILYWLVTEKRANLIKPKLKKATFTEHFRRLASTIAAVIIVLQLFGLHLFPFPISPALLLTGMGLLLTGTIIMVVARIELGNNWTHAADYQIRKNQDLVTTGIYSYIRNPIYSGALLVFIGAELIAGSFLVILCVPIFIGGYIQAKREERILERQFGKNYEKYKKNSKMFFPYII